MRRGVLALIGLSGLAACDAPARSYVWFKDHPAVAAKVAADCGPNGSDDCRNAEKAVADTKSDRRLSAYRKVF